LHRRFREAFARKASPSGINQLSPPLLAILITYLWHVMDIVYGDAGGVYLTPSAAVESPSLIQHALPPISRIAHTPGVVDAGA
jgi:hypothetical protein